MFQGLSMHLANEIANTCGTQEHLLYAKSCQKDINLDNFENDFANTYFKRQFDPNFRRLCKEYEDDREGYLRKWAKLDPVWHEPVEPKKINLDTFTSIFNEQRSAIHISPEPPSSPPCQSWSS